RFVYAMLESFLGFELGELGAYETEHDLLACRQETQRRKTAGALIVVFEKIPIHGDLAQEDLSDRVVVALAQPRALIVATAKVNAHRHVFRPIPNRIV